MRQPKGSISKTATGYQLRIEIGGKPYKHTFGTHEEAVVAREELLRAVDPDVAKTLSGFGLRWFANREKSGVYRHTKKERSIWDAHVEPWDMAHHPMSRLQRKHIAAFVAELSTKASAKGTPLSRQSVKHALRLVKRCLDAASDLGMIGTNPAIGVEVPRRAGQKRSWTYLEADEISRVLSVEHDARGEHPELVTLERRAIYAIAIFAGLRKSEIWSLRWEDVTLEGPRPRIHVREGKSDSAVRDVPLLPQAIEHLTRWRDRDAQVKRAFGLIFPPSSRSARATRDDSSDAGWRDHPYTYGGVRKVRLGTASRAGIDRKVRFHDLRHTCASHLVMGTWTPEPLTIAQARKWLGHSSSSVTDRYAHMSDEGLHTLIEGEESTPKSKAARKPPSAT